jgi:uncharacterized protein YjbJ (UPF0337 family)
MTTHTIPEYLEEERQKAADTQLRTEVEAARIQALQRGHHRTAKQPKLALLPPVKAATKKKRRTVAVAHGKPRASGKDGSANPPAGLTDRNRIQKIRNNKIKEELMNKDQVTGKIDQAVGRVEQSVGKSFGSEKLANKGVVKQAKGAVQETWGDAKEAAKQIHESHKEAASEKAAERRKNLSQSVDDTKEKAKVKIEEFKERHSA